MTRSVVPLPGRNVALELEVLYPAGGSETALPEDGGPLSAPGTTLLALHPWGWLGGCMDDPVVVSLCRAAAASGRFSTVVRYNMRGVGSSRGFRALTSGPDTEDLVALVKLLMMGSGQQQQQQQHNDPAPAAAAAAATLGAPSSHTQCPQAPVQPLVCGGQRAGHAGDCSGARGDLVAGQRRRLVVAAYSYGSCVASRALPQLAPWLDAFAVVGFPMGALCRVFLASAGAWEQLASCHSLPRLLCSGDCDQFTDVGALRTAVRRAREAGAAAVTDTSHQGSTGTSGTQVHGAANAVAGQEWRQETGGRQAGPGGRAPLDLAVWPGCDHFFYAGSTQPEEDVDAGERVRGREWMGRGAVEAGGDGERRGSGRAGHSAERGSLRPWHAVAQYVVEWAAQHT